MAVIFPDIEMILVSFLTGALADITEPIAANVRVGTKKLPPEMNASKEVVLIGSYNDTLDQVRRSATVTVDVYADSYEVASELALLVAALVTLCNENGVKRSIVSLGPVRQSNDGPQEKRSMSVDLIVKGSSL